jgi:hypothetical protein
MMRKEAEEREGKDFVYKKKKQLRIHPFDQHRLFDRHRLTDNVAPKCIELHKNAVFYLSRPFIGLFVERPS